MTPSRIEKAEVLEEHFLYDVSNGEKRTFRLARLAVQGDPEQFHLDRWMITDAETGEDQLLCTLSSEGNIGRRARVRLQPMHDDAIKAETLAAVPHTVALSNYIGGELVRRQTPAPMEVLERAHFVPDNNTPDIIHIPASSA